LPPVLQALITFAAEESEPSKTPFYIAAALLVAWALLLFFVGGRRKDTFPSSKTQARGVMALSVVLVAAAMTTAVLTG
jgi:hypothetical protein